MSNIDNGGAAYPLSCSTPKPDGGIHRPCEYGDENPGMTLLDYFAAQALASIGSNRVEGLGWKIIGDRAYGSGQWRTTPAMQAEAAYRIAEAMIAEKRKREAST